MRIPQPYISRVSNLTVTHVAGQRPVSEIIMKRQALFMGALARRPSDDPTRFAVLLPGNISVRQPLGVIAAWQAKTEVGDDGYEA